MQLSDEAKREISSAVSMVAGMVVAIGMAGLSFGIWEAASMAGETMTGHGDMPGLSAGFCTRLSYASVVLILVGLGILFRPRPAWQ